MSSLPHQFINREIGGMKMRVVFHYASTDDTIGIELIAVRLAELLWKEVVKGCGLQFTQGSQLKNKTNCQSTANSQNVGSIVKNEGIKLLLNSPKNEAPTEASDLSFTK